MSEQPHIRCVRAKGGLYGASEYDHERLERFSPGIELDVTIKQRRSGPRHRFYFAILSVILPNLPEGSKFPNVEILHEAIKLELGYREPFLSLDGEVHFKPGSIAFDAMDDATFNEFLQRAFDLIVRELIPGLDIRTVAQRAKDSLGRTYRSSDITYRARATA